MRLSKLILILAAGIMVAAACNTKKETELELSTEGISVNAIGGTKTFNVISNSAWNITWNASWLSVTPASGKKSEQVTVKIDPYAESLSQNREAVITIQSEDGKIIQNIAVSQSWRNIEPGQFLIEEIFFSGNNDETGHTADGEQYIKIRNNSDETLYADGLIIAMENFFYCQQSVTGSYWAHPELNDAICIEDAFQIAGSGTDYPVEAGKSFIIAMAAQDFSANNPNAFDLSKADFEIYEENETYADIDNPDVPNLNVVFKRSNTITMLHKRGYECYALISLPPSVSLTDFADNYKYDVDIDFWMNGSILTSGPLGRRAPTAHKVPNEWVLDGVNCGVEENFRAPEFNSNIDAGYTGCGKTDNDESRFGKSALRKSANGKLTDTNNSTNDFTRDAVPTLKK